MNVAVFIQGIATLAWLLFIVAVVFAVLRFSRTRDIKGLGALVVIALVLALVVSSLSAGVVFVQPENRGVVISAVSPNGYHQQALQPGLRWIIPFLENVVTYPVFKQTYTMSIAPQEGQIKGDDSVTARTSDGQEIFVDASVIYSIDPSQVVQVHITWQDRYSDDLVRPLSRGIIRDTVSQFKVEEVYSTRRSELTQQITEALAEKLNENGLLLSVFILRNITFSPEYAASVEQKQIAEQLAQQAKFVVEQKKQEAEQARQVAQGQADAAVIQAQGSAQARLIEADAEAKALDLIAAALQDNPDLLTYQYITKLSPGIQVMLVPNDTPYLLPLPTIGPSAPTQGLAPQPTSAPAPSPTPTAEPTATPTTSP